MRICVFGAGAVGGYLAGSMADAGLDVSVVARGAQLAAMRAGGITVELGERTLRAPVRASDNPADLGAQDAVIVTVKVPSLPSVAATIAPLLGPETPVCFINNGVPWWYFQGRGDARLPRLDPDDALRRAVGAARVVGGVFWPACAVPAPGVIRMVSGAGRGTVIGTPTGAETPGIALLADAFRRADLPVTVSDRLRDVIWEKLAFNLSAGPMCVLTTTPVKDTQTEAACVAASRNLMREAMALIRAMGSEVAMDMDRVVAVNRELGHRPSILQDLLAGRKMEIDALYQVPLEMAREAGVAMPTLELLVGLIKVRARAAGLYDG